MKKEIKEVNKYRKKYVKNYLNVPAKKHHSNENY